MLVLLRHSIKPFWSDLSVPYIPIGSVDLGAIFLNGWAGVDLFFVLSGFLIGSHLLQAFEKQSSFWGVLRNYAPRRFLRIAPVYYVVLALAVLGLFPFYPYPESMENIGWRIAYHLVFMQDFWPSDIVVVFWSLGTEIKFYLLAPFLIFGLLKIKHEGVRIGILAALVLSQPLVRAMFAPEYSDFEAYFFHVRTVFYFCLDGLLMGVLAAFLWHSEGIRAALRRQVVASTLFWGGLFVFVGINLGGPLVDAGVTAFDRSWLVFVIAGAFSAMLLGLMGECFGHKAFAGRRLTFVALISYSLYLVHLPALYFTFAMMSKFGAFEPESKFSYVISLPLFFAVSVAMATVLYVMIERPIIAWSKKRFSLYQKQGGEA